MIQQMIDSSKRNLGSTESGLPSLDKQQPVAVKKIALRDLQNEIRSTMPTSTGNAPISKQRGSITDSIKVSGPKRPSPELPGSPPSNQVTSVNAANGHLVYVRRKSEAELGRSSTCNNASNSADCLDSRNLHHMEEAIQLKAMQLNSQMKEPKISSLPASAPTIMASLMSSSGKSSLPVSLGKSGKVLSPTEPSNLPLTSTSTLLNNSKEKEKNHWEDRYLQLTMVLRDLDQSDQEEYLQMLRSLSPVELSRRAVELEKRSIQLSLEEARELQRVAALNVMGKSNKIFKASSTQENESGK